MSVLLKNSFQREGQHLTPPGPVVIDVRAPEVERVWDIFRFQDVGEMLAAFRRFVVSLPGQNVN